MRQVHSGDLHVRSVESLTMSAKVNCSELIGRLAFLTASSVGARLPRIIAKEGQPRHSVSSYRLFGRIK
jgi:hypothetical protein